MTKSNVWHTAGTILLITGIISFAIMLAILIWGHGSIYFLSFHVIGSTCMISVDMVSVVCYTIKIMCFHKGIYLCLKQMEN